MVTYDKLETLIPYRATRTAPLATRNAKRPTRKQEFCIMPQQLADRRDQDFVLWEQMNCEDILTHGKYSEFTKKTCEMIINEARTLAIRELLPLLAEGDQQGVRFESGAVKVPESFHRVFELIKDGEWNSLGVPAEMGGQPYF